MPHPAQRTPSSGSNRPQVLARRAGPGSVSRRSEPLAVLQRAQADIRALSPSDVLTLQRSIGNRATQRLLAAGSGAPAQIIQRDDTDEKEDSTDGKKGTKWMGFAKSGKKKGEKQWKLGNRAKQKEEVGSEDTSTEVFEGGFDKEELIEEIEFLDKSVEGTDEDKSVKPVYLPTSVFGRFQSQYNAHFKGYPHIQTDVTARANEFSELAKDFAVENYVVQVLGNEKVSTLLAHIDQQAKTVDKTTAQQTARLIADLVLFASLIPTQVTEYKRKRKTSLFKRLTANVISPARLIELLIQIDQQLAAKEDVTEGASLQGIDLDDKDSVAQRMLKLSLVNMQKSAREKLQKDPLFQEMFKSPDILRIMMASGGAIEQQFLNTCAAAAVTQEIQDNVSNLAGLLLAGRGVLGYIQEQLGDKELVKFLDERHKGFKSSRVSIGDLAKKRIKQAESEFTEIQEAAMELLQKKPVNVAALQELTRRWARTMQKLSAVVNLTEGAAKVPVLSKKRIEENWNASAVVATLAGGWADRAKRRKTGIEEGDYRGAFAETVNISTSRDALASVNLNEEIGGKKEERIEKLKAFWDQVFESGGTEFSVPGHALYMQAVMRGDEKMFVIGDPLIDKHEYYTVPEMEKYARSVKKKELKVRPDLLRGPSPPAYLRSDGATLYLSPINLGKTTNNTVKMDRNAQIRELNSEQDKQEGTWKKITVMLSNGEEKVGWVHKDQITVF